MKPGNDLTGAGLLLFAALCELVCELLKPKPSHLPICGCSSPRMGKSMARYHAVHCELCSSLRTR
jgi:hypothetical protein